MRPTMDPSSCILVEDAKVIAQDEPSLDSTIPHTPTEESFLTSTAVHLGGPSPSLAVSTDHQQQQPQIEHQSAQQPPSASTVEIPRLGEPQSFTVPPSRFWNSEFRNKQPAFVRFNISLPWGANFAVYGRRNVAPSITQYDFAEFVKGGRVDHRLRRSVLAAPVTLPSQSARGTKTYDFETQTSQVRSRRSAPMHVNVTLLQYLDAGRWFLSVYNDDLRPHDVLLIVEEAEGISTACPNDCSGHGSCYLGKCDCIDGFEGIDCAKSVCPVLCSNHGKYGGGVCHCEEGWKGPECDVPEADCHGDCSGHGSCVEGSCACRPGWTGPACNQAHRTPTTPHSGLQRSSTPHSHLQRSSTPHSHLQRSSTLHLAFSAPPLCTLAFSAPPLRTLAFSAPLCTLFFSAPPLRTLAFSAPPLRTLAFRAPPLCTLAFSVPPLCTLAFSALPLCTLAFSAPPLRTLAFSVPPLCTLAFSAPPLRTLAFSAPPLRTLAFSAPPLRTLAFSAPPLCTLAFSAPLRTLDFSAPPLCTLAFSAPPFCTLAFSAPPFCTLAFSAP
ncbi:EGF-like domain [Nesidiocoris tenuis]|uniref:EGF-like domain n=1 Tax=Nesidiocoris tenuis TaxID=355587 RepID=A0ABN7B8D6_9HEMI|nr:EGF-like domain [Nesidiocoris tenuis]